VVDGKQHQTVGLTNIPFAPYPRNLHGGTPYIGIALTYERPGIVFVGAFGETREVIAMALVRHGWPGYRGRCWPDEVLIEGVDVYQAEVGKTG
jgi:hypothetical protein